MHLGRSSMSTKNPPVNSTEVAQADRSPPDRNGPRVAYDEVTGYSYVTARPGEPMVTNEEIKRQLEDFP
jgi:hypothetical protein